MEGLPSEPWLRADMRKILLRCSLEDVGLDETADAVTEAGGCSLRVMSVDQAQGSEVRGWQVDATTD